MFNYASSQRLYLWRQKREIIHEGKPQATNPDPEPAAKQGGKQIASLARRLELQALQKQ